MPYKNWEDYLANKRKWRSENRDKVNVIKNRYRKKYPEKEKERKRRYYKKYREILLKKASDYRKTHLEYFKQQQSKYYHSPRGYVLKMFDGIKKRIKHKKSYKHRKLLFTLQEFKAFIIDSEAYLTTFDTWVRSGYKHALAPSVDRVDNTKDYSLDNIQIITVSENSRKSRKVLSSVL